MFEPKRASQDNLSNYIGARVTDAEEEWLRSEMKRHKLTMSDLIRLALGNLRASRSAGGVEREVSGGHGKKTAAVVDYKRRRS